MMMACKLEGECRVESFIIKKKIRRVYAYVATYIIYSYK